MQLTEQLKSWLREHKGVDAEASDDDYKKAAASALVDGSLEQEKFVDLTAPNAKKANSFEEKLDRLLELTGKNAERIDVLEKERQASPVRKEPEEEKKGEPEFKLKDTAPKMPEGLQEKLAQSDEPTKDPYTGEIKVIRPQDRYDKTRTAALWPKYSANHKSRFPFAGQQAFVRTFTGEKRYLDMPSQLDRACNGTYFKWRIVQNGTKGVTWTEHDQQLFDYMTHELEWCGPLGNENSMNCRWLEGEKLGELGRKQLVDNSATGGQFVTPIVFDENIVMLPLLSGEFFPRVTVVNVTTRRIESAQMSNVTVEWVANGDNTAAGGDHIDLQSTSNFINAFNTNVHVAQGSILVGRDLLADSPIALFDRIAEEYGKRMTQQLDVVIATGDGTTQPLGITQTPSVPTVSAANGNTGPPTVGDYEGLLFGVTKAFKQGTPTDRIAFGGSQVSYRRARGIAVSGSDQRRVFGMDHESWSLFGHPYAVGGGLANTQILFANFEHYRMYRRMGIDVQSTTEGRNLMRDNQMLIVARQRYGGQLEHFNYAALTTNAQT